MRPTRRQFLATAAAVPAAAALPLALPGAAAAQQATPFLQRGFTLGEMRVTPLLAAQFPVEAPQQLFGTNVPAEEFAAVSAENFLPADAAVLDIAPALVAAGDNLILFDTGVAAGGLLAALAAAGHAPGDVTHVVLTHMHPDHIGGLTGDDGSATFPEAAYVAGRAEFDFWAASGDEGFAAKVAPFAERMTFLAEGGTVAPGITAVETFGHTPGHMAYRLESGGRQILLWGDVANHYVWSVGYPDWDVAFDADKAAAAATRRRVLDMAAADRMAILGYHMPFPGLGFIETRGAGFRWVPVSYQFG